MKGKDIIVNYLLTHKNQGIKGYAVAIFIIIAAAGLRVWPLGAQLCIKTTGVISDHNHELGERLRCMTEDLNYKEILEALDNIKGWN